MKYTYRWGQRPLEGFTIKRGLGQGGFGEVYFAVSDGGKEVALKLLIRGRTDTELRGISNCLNLKHPNLVHLYDLRTDDRGDHWLVMEYIQGESLSNVLNRHSKGLAPEQAKKWFLQVARAAAYLHDHAIIHRDIKPANVFLENGSLKLGDYGLSKSVGLSLEQSANVGTVYYMAPEMGKGACTKQVDVYACGVMLYEMLTGDLPFRGDSWAEVALRHQTDTPELSKLPAEYLAIVEKAMHKKPELRYADMDEMIRAVEAVGLPVASVAPPKEAALVMQTEERKSRTTPPPLPKRDLPPLPTNPSTATLAVLPTMSERIAELTSSLAMVPFAGFIVVAAWALLQAMFANKVDWYSLLPTYALTMVLSWLVLLPAKAREKKKKRQGQWVLMLMGALLGIGVYWMEGWTFPSIVAHGSAPAPEESYLAGTIRATPGMMNHLLGYIVFFMAALAIVPWWDYVARRRRERFSFSNMIIAGLCTFFLWLGWQIFQNNESLPTYLFVAMVGASGVVQMVSPWTPPPPPQPRKRRLEYA
jgi:serine/threonine protein kinase